MIGRTRKHGVVLAMEAAMSRRADQRCRSKFANWIRTMSLAHPLWGAPRIHGELLKLGIDVGQTSVAKYMARHSADGIASLDLFVVPTLSFRVLYGLLILGHARRQILWLGVTAHPTAEWMARQLTEACGCEYIVRDRDLVYGEFFARRLRAI